MYNLFIIFMVCFKYYYSFNKTIKNIIIQKINLNKENIKVKKPLQLLIILNIMRFFIFI